MHLWPTACPALGVISMVALLAAACTTGDQLIDADQTTTSAWEWQLPLGFAPPPVPDNNPMSIDKVELGRRLFYDNRMSVNDTGSCASCHLQRLAFSDGRANAIGVTGQRHPRSSMSLVNVAYNANYTWASREVRTLELQIPIPLFNEQPIELGLRGREEILVEILASDPGYRDLFQKAFPESNSPVVIDNIVRALASFVRSIISADSAFDRRLFEDDENAMSASAIRGMQLFFSDNLGCSACHADRTLAGSQQGVNGPLSGAEFHNTGLYNVDGGSLYPRVDSGLRMESDDPDDDGKFSAPSLRNIALTGPYMHDGSIATLSDVVDHYAAGGRSTKLGALSGDGRENLKKSPLLTGFALSDTDKEALLNFLESLTDYSVLSDPRFASPSINRD